MKELELNLIDKLTSLYKDYLNNGLTEEISKNAQALYDEYIQAKAILSSETNTAIQGLFTIAYPKVKNLEKPSKEDIKNYIKNLEKVKLSLEK